MCQMRSGSVSGTNTVGVGRRCRPQQPVRVHARGSPLRKGTRTTSARDVEDAEWITIPSPVQRCPPAEEVFTQRLVGTRKAVLTHKMPSSRAIIRHGQPRTMRAEARATRSCASSLGGTPRRDLVEKRNPLRSGKLDTRVTCVGVAEPALRYVHAQPGVTERSERRARGSSRPSTTTITSISVNWSARARSGRRDDEIGPMIGDHAQDVHGWARSRRR